MHDQKAKRGEVAGKCCTKQAKLTVPLPPKRPLTENKRQHSFLF